MSISRRALLGLSAASGAAVGVGKALATDLACLPDRRTEVLARKQVYVPGHRQPHLGEALHRYADREGWHFSGSGASIFLLSPRLGTEVEVDFEPRSDAVRMTAKSNCTAPQDDWRRYWVSVTTFVDRWRRG